MDLGDCLGVLFICILFYQGATEGGYGKLLEEVDSEIEEQLKHLNKPAVKTIQSVDGATYDCVDFYKQPAFDHPTLQNYTIDLDQMSSSIRAARKKIGNIFSNNTIDLKLKKVKCPAGTVPIRRMTKSDLIREKRASTFRSLFAGENPDADYAVARTKAGPKRYKGGGGTVTLDRPDVSGKQYSAARLVLKNGADSIEVGWRVDPVLYGDNQCHLFVRTVINNRASFGVRNPGFVSTNKDIPIDAILETSVRSGSQKRIIGMNLYIIRDADGSWLLFGGKNSVQIGFWPSNIFSSDGLTQIASYVEWGGEVYSPPGTPKPPMGSGSLPKGRSDTDCLYYKMIVGNENGGTVDADDLETFADNPNYVVKDEGNQGSVMGHLIVFGGPAGS